MFEVEAKGPGIPRLLLWFQAPGVRTQARPFNLKCPWRPHHRQNLKPAHWSIVDILGEAKGRWTFGIQPPRPNASSVPVPATSLHLNSSLLLFGQPRPHEAVEHKATIWQMEDIADI
jgi:hypothetical protein